MTPLIEDLVRRLVFAPETLSRNRNYHTFTDPDARRARRVAAHIRSVRKGARSRTVDGRATRLEDGTWRVELVDRDNGVRRTAHLTETEMAILCEDPEAAAGLGIDPTAPA